MNSVSSHAAGNSEVRIFSEFEETAPMMLDQTGYCLCADSVTYVLSAFISSSVGESIVDNRGSEAAIARIRMFANIREPKEAESVLFIALAR